MHSRPYIFKSIFLIIYGLLNFYIARRGWQALNGGPLTNLGIIWFAAVIIMAVMFPALRFVSNYLEPALSRPLIIISSYWLGIMYYLFLITLGLDLIRGLDRIIGFLPANLKTPHPSAALAIVITLIIIQVYGTWNAHHPVVNHYDLKVAQKCNNLTSLRVVMVSDIHLGWIVGVDRLRDMAATINSLNPDLVLLAGDIVDEGVDLSAEEEIPQAFAALRPQLGTFAVLGNHEYISGKAESVAEYLKQGGVKVLRDQWIQLDKSLYLVGRDDMSRGAFKGGRRLELTSLMHGIDTGYLPVLLMDHQPAYLDEADQAGVDLQFSGHTHRGQIAPNNLITKRIFEQDWGYLQKQHLQVLVSSGFGTWGPPIRVGNRPEILEVNIHFVPTS